MCGRYGLFLKNPVGEVIPEMQWILDEISKRYQDTPEMAAMKTGEIRPTDTVPVLVWEDGTVHARLMRWGFHLRQGASLIINARSETVMEKQTFRGLMRSQRCVVPSTVYYEWQHVNGKVRKTKYQIHLRDQAMLYMAGLYQTEVDKQGNPYTAFVILTTEPNGIIAPLHDRMPLVLEGGDRRAWLRDYGAAVELLYGKKDTPFDPMPEEPRLDDLAGTFFQDTPPL